MQRVLTALYDDDQPITEQDILDTTETADIGFVTGFITQRMHLAIFSPLGSNRSDPKNSNSRDKCGYAQGDIDEATSLLRKAG